MTDRDLLPDHRGYAEIRQNGLTADWELAVAGQQPYKIEPLR